MSASVEFDVEVSCNGKVLAEAPFGMSITNDSLLTAVGIQVVGTDGKDYHIDIKNIIMECDE